LEGLGAESGLARYNRLRQDGVEIGRSQLCLDDVGVHLLGFSDLVVQNVSDCRLCRLCGQHSGLESELQLGLRGSVELLVDRRVVAIEDDVGTGGVAVSLEDQDGSFRYGEEKSKLREMLVYVILSAWTVLSSGWRIPCCTNLLRENLSTKIAQSELETAVLVGVEDFDDDKSVAIDARSRDSRRRRSCWSHGSQAVSAGGDPGSELVDYSTTTGTVATK
jgi:hypothetical protein